MDFEKLEYLGSAGLRVVFMTASELEKRDAAFAVCSPPKPIAKVIKLSGMEQLIPVHPFQGGRPRRALTGSARPCPGSAR